MSQPLDTEPNIRNKVSRILSERLVRNAVIAIQAEQITPTRELVAQMIRMIDQLRTVPDDISQARLATETIRQTLEQVETGEWDDKIEAMHTGDYWNQQ